MATEYGFFPHSYFAESYFPAVWFAPVIDETPVILPADGGASVKPTVRKPPVKLRPVVLPRPFVFPLREDEEDEALLLCL